MQITQITDHVDAAKARLLQQYQDDDNLKGLVEIDANQTQDEEDMGWDLLTKRALSTAEGAQLDLVGAILGRARATDQNDDDYRDFLEFRVTELLSEGTINDLLFIFQFLMGAASVELQEVYPAHFNLVAVDPNPLVNIAEVHEAIRKAKAPGVGYAITTPIDNPFGFFNDPDAEGFSGLDAPESGGDFSGLL